MQKCQRGRKGRKGGKEWSLGCTADGKNTLSKAGYLGMQNLMTNCSYIKRELFVLLFFVAPFTDTKRPMPTLAFLQLKKKSAQIKSY